jgi:hypothetical protein
VGGDAAPDAVHGGGVRACRFRVDGDEDRDRLLYWLRQQLDICELKVRPLVRDARLAPQTAQNGNPLDHATHALV